LIISMHADVMIIIEKCIKYFPTEKGININIDSFLKKLGSSSNLSDIKKSAEREGSSKYEMLMKLGIVPKFNRIRRIRRKIKKMANLRNNYQRYQPFYQRYRKAFSNKGFQLKPFKSKRKKQSTKKPFYKNVW